MAGHIIDTWAAQGSLETWRVDLLVICVDLHRSAWYEHDDMKDMGILGMNKNILKINYNSHIRLLYYYHSVLAIYCYTTAMITCFEEMRQDILVGSSRARAHV